MNNLLLLLGARVIGGIAFLKRDAIQAAVEDVLPVISPVITATTAGDHSGDHGNTIPL